MVLPEAPAHAGPRGYLALSSTLRGISEPPYGEAVQSNIQDAANNADMDVSSSSTDKLKGLLDRFNHLAIGQITAALDAVASAESTPIIDRLEAMRAVQALAALHVARLAELEQASRDGPPEAPQLYRDREHYKESPADFIRRVYAPWLKEGKLTRSDLHRCDIRLYTSFMNYCAKKGTPPDLDLPTRRHKTDAMLATIGGPDGEIVQELLRFSRLASRIANARQNRRGPRA